MKPFLIVGHTTGSSTIIWICGTRRYRSATVALRGGDGRGNPDSQVLQLPPDTDFTSSCTFEQLQSDTDYEISVRFHRKGRFFGLLPRPRDELLSTGKLRTFPHKGADEPFSFLHGSCNLSTVALTHVGGLAAAGLGALMAGRSLTRDSSFYDWGLFQWAHPLMRLVLSKAVPLAVRLFYGVTRFELPKPLLQSPFEQLFARASAAESREAAKMPPSFAIHAGDQIYFDFPFPGRKPTPEQYRSAYRGAWSEDPSMREFLAQCPHYMILDDHEIVDEFANDSIPEWAAKRKSKSEGELPEVRTPGQYLGAATEAYRDYVDCRHPSADNELFYEFSHGKTRFFVLDTRTERYRHKGEMISAAQLDRLKGWLAEDPSALKFVVSSVPFVAQLRHRTSGRGNGNGAGKPSGEESPDKWSCEPYRRQRDEIVEFLLEKEVGRVVFLVGDMHCTYHASMRIGEPARRITVHELASGPIHQLQFASRGDFHRQYRGTTSYRDKIPFATSMGFIHGATGNMVRVTAQPGKARVAWKVIPTCGASAQLAGKGGRLVQNEPGLPLGGTIHLGACQ
jgi:hypothetical protein